MPTLTWIKTAFVLQNGRRTPHPHGMMPRKRVGPEAIRFRRRIAEAMSGNIRREMMELAVHAPEPDDQQRAIKPDAQKRKIARPATVLVLGCRFFRLTDSLILREFRKKFAKQPHAK
jgi:hypothetical protein